MPGENPKTLFTPKVGGEKSEVCEGDQRTYIRGRWLSAFCALQVKMQSISGFPVAYASAFLAGKSVNSPKTQKRWPGRKRGLLRASLAALMLTTSGLPAFAAVETASFSNSLQTFLADRSSVLLLAIFCGAISFSFLAVFWMIRERARISEENNRLRKGFSGMRAERDRMAAMLEVEDLCVIVWNGDMEGAKILGSLDPASGAPQTHERFLAFGTWLTPGSTMELETAIRQLRVDGQQFTLELASRTDGTLEAQGRVSGGQAFVRFVVLDGTRENLANVNRDHQQLMRRFSVIEQLFEALPSPLWIRSRDGQLAYANPAYAAAVEAEDADMAVRGDKSLFDAKERSLLQAELEAKGRYARKPSGGDCRRPQDDGYRCHQRRKRQCGPGNRQK